MDKNNYSFFGFTCVKCNYRCNRKNDLDKHLRTQKHKRNMLRIEEKKRMSIQNVQYEEVRVEKKPAPALMNLAQTMKTTFKCECGKSYKHMSSLCKHKKKCTFMICQPTESYTTSTNVAPPAESLVLNKGDITHTTEETALVLKQDTGSGTKTNNSADSSLNEIVTNLLMQQNQRNEELKTLLAEQSKQMTEMSNKVNVTNINTTNNNTVNNKFNLNVFLNNECKDAMNMGDFIESLSVNTKDLESFGSFGFVEGVTRILLRGLRALDIYKRPIHCSDMKREQIYIKDNNTWEKDDNKDKMQKVIRHVRHKNMKQIPNWQQENPGHNNFSSRTHGRYVGIMNNALGGANDQEDEYLQNKIVKKVLPDVMVPKALRFKMLYNK